MRSEDEAFEGASVAAGGDVSRCSVCSACGVLGVVLLGLGDNAAESRHANDEEDGCDRRRPEDWYNGWLSGVGEARNTSAMLGGDVVWV